jgi:AraC-like DNA-binding protein
VKQRVRVRDVGTPAPFSSRRLHADDWLVVHDVRCAEVPPPLGDVEATQTLDIVFPVSGGFVRHVGRVGHGRRVVGDVATALVFRPAEPYRVTHPRGGGDRSLSIALRPRAVDDFGRSIGSLPDAVPTSVHADLLVRRWLAYAGSDQPDALEAFEVAAALVGHVLGDARGTGRTVAADWAADAVRLELAADLGARVTMPELGRRVGLSPFHLARRFRAATGMSIHRWRRTLRVREALARIDAGERDLAGLAMDLGFAHHSHLSNEIRAETGQPPSAFRRPPTARDIARLRTILQA